VVQRRPITLDESVFPLVEGLFAVETHMTMEERIRLLEIGSLLPQRFVACEVGSYVGASTGFLALAARFKQGHIHCVDTWDNRAMGQELPRDTYGEFLRNTEAFRQFITTHRGESATLAGQVPDGLDFLFIDADHSYQAAKADLAAFAPKLKRGGILLLHDFAYETVRQACSEYMKRQSVVDLGLVHTLQAFQLSAAAAPLTTQAT
jgi:predicted O-methyltransferase YrrM